MRRSRRNKRLSYGAIAAVATVLGANGIAVAATLWPGLATVQTVDQVDQFGGNLSGLTYEPSGTAAPGVLWAVRNGPGEIYRLVWDGTKWVPDTSNGWQSGKTLAFPGGVGDVDAEGATIADGDSTSVYVASERDNANNSTSRNSILRFDTTGSGAALTAVDEWDLTSDLPTTAPNGGLEGLTWIPDSVLVAEGFVDEATTQLYDPALYPNHGTGIFFAALDSAGEVFAYALNHTTGTSTRVATINSGLSRVMGLEFDSELTTLWAQCDNNCDGQMSVLYINATGAFAVSDIYDRPTGLANGNTEGLAITPLSECDSGNRPVIWVDDNETDGHALREGGLECPSDPVVCDGLIVTVNLSAGQSPTQGNDVILGTDIGEVINGLGGDDVICGLGGDDLLIGGDGDDTLIAGAGADIVQGGTGNDVLQGGPDGDQLFGEAGLDLLEGGEDPDFLDGGPDDDHLRGGAGDDQLYGYAGDDILEGGLGADQLYGFDGTDALMGEGPGITGGDADYLWGGPGIDTYDGGGGDDWLEGNDGGENAGEMMVGGAGNDIILGHGGEDTLDGGAGLDYLWGGPGIDTYDGGPDRDTLDGNDGGEDAGEVMNGGDGQDDILGWGGNDTLNGDAGPDYIWGGAGVDSFNGGDDGDTLQGFDSGEDAGEIMNGGAGNDIIVGHGGDDTLNGGTGSDYLWGGEGADVLSGDADIDTCVDPQGQAFDGSCEFAGS